jgi:hypothetical protein
MKDGGGGSGDAKTSQELAEFRERRNRELTARGKN